jgi:MFS family permease
MKIVAAAIVGNMLEFFDHYVIGFGLPFIVRPWHLAFGMPAIILTASGAGAIVPPFMFFTGWLILWGCAFLLWGFETGKQSISDIDRALGEPIQATAGGGK